MQFIQAIFIQDRKKLSFVKEIQLKLDKLKRQYSMLPANIILFTIDFKAMYPTDMRKV